MVQRRRSAPCPHDDPARPYPVWPEPGREPGVDPAVDAALEELSTELNRFVGELSAAVEAMSLEELCRALKSASVEARAYALHLVGLNVAPRHVGEQLCRDVFRRLKRADDHVLRHAVPAIATSAIRNVFQAAYASDGGATRDTDLEERWGPALLRAAFWAPTLATVRDSRVCAWACEQQWIKSETVTADAISALARAAAAVIELTPQYGRTEVGEPEAAATDWHDEENAAPPSESDLRGPRKGEDMQEASPPASPTPERRTQLIGELASAFEELETCFGTALSPARRIAAAIESQCPPDRADLASLTALRSRFNSVTDALRGFGFGVEIEAESLTSIAGHIARVRTSAADIDLRNALVEILAIRSASPTDGLDAPLSVAQEQVGRLLAAGEWDTAQRQAAEVLTGLVPLRDSQLDPAERIKLTEHIVTAFPQLATLAVLAHKLQSVAQDEVEAPPVSDEGDITQATATDELVASESESDPLQVAVQGESESAKSQETPPQPVEPSSSSPSLARTETEPYPQTPVENSLRVQVRSEESEHVDSSKLVSRESSDGSDVERREGELLLAQLVESGRFGMAAALTTALGDPGVRRDVLEAAALAGAVQSENGACRPFLRARFEALDADKIANDTPSLLLVVPALVRAAVVTGDPASGALLNALVGRLESNLADIAQNVGKRALQGVLAGSMALTVAADDSGSERSFRNLGDRARDVMRRRQLRYSRATEICKSWLATDGMLGRPLSLVANDDQDALDEVREAIAKLRDEAEVVRELDLIDTRLRGSSGRRLEGPARRDVLARAAEAVSVLASWADEVAAKGRRGDQWSIDEVSAMREAVLGRSQAALDALSVHEASGDVMTAAAARAAVRSLTATFAMLSGERWVRGAEPLPESVITAELLKVPGATFDVLSGRARVRESITVAELATAAEVGWLAGIDIQTQAENFTVANALLDAAAAGLVGEPVRDPEQIQSARKQLRAIEAEQRTQLRRDGERLAAALRRARLSNQTSDEQDNELTRRLDDAVQDDRELIVARASLASIEQLLTTYQDDSKSRLHGRLEALPKATQSTVERIAGYIDSGQLSIAEELIYFAEIGEPVPDSGAHQRDDLARCFPAVPAALPMGITVEFVRQVLRREVVSECPELDFTRLSEDSAAATADALHSWRTLGTMPAEDRSRISERELLIPALRLAGIDARTFERLDRMTRGRGTERRFIELREVTVHGRPPVPEFGSKLNGRLRVMLAWGRLSAEALLSFADEDPSGDSLLIAHFGTMSERTRRELAVRAVASRAPIVVLDDAVLAYLAARGNGQIDAAMALLLPFSSVNPYVREKRGLVAQEMFYGREAEGKALVDPNGTQIIFGGRGLGKSALLRHTATEFENQMLGYRTALYLSVDTEGIAVGSSLGAEAIWVALRRRLADRDGFEPIGSKHSTGDHAHEFVRETLVAWIKGDSRRRMLILLDECDRFFESDAPSFVQTRRLKDLGQQTDGRVKVVFAGLHSVQRFAKAAPNGPFSHLAQRPTVIGPLRPQFASDLLTSPLRALGFAFDNDDIVNRILSYCSYQPFLLQMFANRLVDAMHRKRVIAKMPPFVITREDIEAVEEQADLRDDINAAFHETLQLDERYNVIANALAHYAFELGLDSRLTETELLGDCRDWWREGFAALDVEAFRAYLHEMVGLGVLAANNDRRGWHLRSPNVLTMIGTRDEVMAQLVGPHPSVPPEEFAALEERMLRPDGRHLPLTASQLSDVTGDHVNQVRVILGSEATGALDVSDAVLEVKTLNDLYDVQRVKGKREFREELVKGIAGKHRVILDDLVTLAPQDEACLDALDIALSQWPSSPGVTRSAVLITGPGQLCLWRALLGPDADRGSRAQAGIVVLRRYNRSTLDLWALQENCFRQSDRRDELLRVTGGWPILVEQVAQLTRFGTSEAIALRQIEDQFTRLEFAGAFVEQVGLAADEDLSHAFDAVLEWADQAPLSETDVHTAIEMQIHDAATMVACLRALQVFDIDGEGRLTPERLLTRFWSLRSR